jgi:alpha-D-ribose 1-methylphosphonate 5-triphosphate diphosphatase
VFEVLEDYIDHPLLSLISLMDHTPGQRQFVDIEKFKHYYMGKHGLTLQQVEMFIEDCHLRQQQYGIPNRLAVVSLIRMKGIAMASHDDATVEHVQEAIADGAVIAEFPTTLAAAQAAHQSNLQVLMGSPNVVLGGSHSGNVSALELITKGCVDILSSDYVPQSLLQSIFTLVEKTRQPLFQAIRLVTSNPAKAINLFDDRGSLEVGKRADLVMIHPEGLLPRLTGVIRQGVRVA